jgi:two-component system, OmpR family, sensor kinase
VQDGPLKSYSAWLHFSFLCVGLPAVIFAWLGWQHIIESQYRLERGRIASDIHAAVTNFDLYKAQLRGWRYEASLTQTPDWDKRATLLAALQEQATAVATQTQAAIALDLQRHKVLREHQQRETLLRIVSVARQMGTLVEDLIDVVRNPALQINLSPQTLPLQTLMQSVTDAARGLGAAKNVAILTPDTLPDALLHTDPDRLCQVLVCLIDNAVRYSHDGGSVRLHCDLTADAQVCIKVIDQGIGISKADQGAIWKRGWRARSARAHRPEGLGLGLAIARQLTQALAGQLTVTSHGKGRGTTATLHMALA